MEKNEFDLMVALFPSNKQKKQMDALVIWNTLSNGEKERVLKHIPMYLNNTNPQFVKQVGDYFQQRIWMKKLESRKDSPLRNKQELLDGNFISYVQDLLELESLDETISLLVSTEDDILKESYRLYLEDKARPKSYSIGRIIAESTNQHGVNYWKDNNGKHYFGVSNKKMFSLTDIQYKLFKDNLYVFTSLDTNTKTKIEPSDLRPYMIYCIKEGHMANYANPLQEILDVKKLKEVLV